MAVCCDPSTFCIMFAFRALTTVLCLHLGISLDFDKCFLLSTSKVSMIR